MGAHAGNMDPGQQSVKGASGEIARVLAAEDLWEVLQIPKQTPADVLRKAKNMKLLLVHPDKLPPKTPGAPEAFQRVTQVCRLDWWPSCWVAPTIC